MSTSQNPPKAPSSSISVSSLSLVIRIRLLLPLRVAEDPDPERPLFEPCRFLDGIGSSLSGDGEGECDPLLPPSSSSWPADSELFLDECPGRDDLRSRLPPSPLTRQASSPNEDEREDLRLGLTTPGAPDLDVEAKPSSSADVQPDEMQLLLEVASPLRSTELPPVPAISASRRVSADRSTDFWGPGNSEEVPSLLCVMASPETSASSIAGTVKKEDCIMLGECMYAVVCVLTPDVLAELW